MQTAEKENVRRDRERERDKDRVRDRQRETESVSRFAVGVRGGTLYAESCAGGRLR